MGGRNIEAIAGIVREPILNDVGNFRGRSDHAETAPTGDFTVELANGRDMALHALEELRADAAQLRRTELVEWNRAVEGTPGEVAERVIETRQPNERIKRLLELVEFRLRLGSRAAHDWPKRV